MERLFLFPALIQCHGCKDHITTRWVNSICITVLTGTGLFPEETVSRVSLRKNYLTPLRKQILYLHTARDSKPFAIPSKEEYLSFCKTIGLEYNFLHIDSENIKYHGTINAQLDFANVPNLTIECGSHDEYCEEKINEVFDGIIRLLVEFGMVDKKFYKDSGVAVPKYFKKTKKITAMDGGYVQFHKNINDKFVKGDLLYSLYNPNSFGEKSDYFAEFDGVAWKFSITHIFMKGEDVVEAIPDSEIKAI